MCDLKNSSLLALTKDKNNNLGAYLLRVDGKTLPKVKSHDFHQKD